MTIPKAILAIVACALLGAAHETIHATVSRVVDGDTLDISRAGKTVRVRLAQIDCPEMAQHYGPAARDFTKEATEGHKVEILVHNHDKYGRIVGEVYCEGKDVNVELVRRGLAWYAPGYGKNVVLDEFQTKARVKKKGLWADDHPVEPWNWRKDHKPHPM